MNFKGIKAKIQFFKSIFDAHWLNFVNRNPRYDTDYYHAEINKMLTCGSEAGGFAVYRCLSCGKKASIKLTLAVKVKLAHNVENVMLEKVWKK